MARVESARNRISISRAKKKKRERGREGEIGKGEGSNLGKLFAEFDPQYEKGKL